ncbi:hypothetical protein Tco_0506085 [Tanacetum coccineum]
MFSVRRFDCFPLSKGDDTFWFGSKTVGMDESLWFVWFARVLVVLFVGVFLAIVDAFVRSEFEISSWRGARVDVRTYLGIIRYPKLELESSRFTFYLVPLSYESVDVVVGENWLLRHKAEMVCHEKVVKMPCVPKELVGFTPRRRIGFRMELVQGATPICEGSCRLTSLERQEVWNDCRSCKVRVGSNGNLLWEAFVLLGRKKGCVMDTLKFTAMPFGLTNAPAVFMELMSRSKEEYESYVEMIVESLKEEKMYVKFSNNVEAEQRGSYLDVGDRNHNGLWVVEGLTLERCSTFGKKDKLESSYVGPFEILGWIGPIVRMSPPRRQRYCWNIAFATGCRRVGRRKRINHTIRVPAFMHSCIIEEELTLVKNFGKEVEEYVTKVIAKDGTVTCFGGRFPHFIEEEEEKKPKPYNLYGFVDLMENEQVYAKTGFAPHRIPQSEGNHNGWLSEEEEADSDSESTASNHPHTG